MMLTDAVAKIEALFTVHEEVGEAIRYQDQDGKSMGDGPRDMTKAPNGKRYVRVSSFGVDADLPDDALVMFGSSGLAYQWWLDEVREYARGIEEDEDKWADLHLYWRVKPTWHSSMYLAMDQGDLMRTASPLARILQIDLGFVESEMLISKKEP